MFIYFIHILPFPDKAYKMRLYFKFKACDWSKCMHARLNWCYDASTNNLMKMLHGNGESYIDCLRLIGYSLQFVISLQKQNKVYLAKVYCLPSTTLISSLTWYIYEFKFKDLVILSSLCMIFKQCEKKNWGHDLCTLRKVMIP